MILNNENLEQIYNECWDQVKNDPGYEDKTKPGIEVFVPDIPTNVVACYVPSAHVICFGPLFWHMYGEGEDLSDDVVKEIYDIVYHEMSHVMYPHHERSFWNQTERHDSVGQKLRDYYQGRLNALEEKIQAAQCAASNYVTNEERLRRLEAAIAENGGNNVQRDTENH